MPKGGHLETHNVCTAMAYCGRQYRLTAAREKTQSCCCKGLFSLLFTISAGSLKKHRILNLERGMLVLVSPSYDAKQCHGRVVAPYWMCSIV